MLHINDIKNKFLKKAPLFLLVSIFCLGFSFSALAVATSSAVEGDVKIVEGTGSEEQASIGAQTRDGEDMVAEIDSSIKLEEDTCPDVDELKLRYKAGCWSCFIVKALVSAFLKVADAAYETSQGAGKTLLLLGTFLWLAFWALKNVSSLAQIDPGNILNELIKMSFKIMLAYFFIVSGKNVIGYYFINPIMGTGADMALAYLDEETVFTGFEDEKVTREQLEQLGKAINQSDAPQDAAVRGEVKTVAGTGDAKKYPFLTREYAEGTPEEDVMVGKMIDALVNLLIQQNNEIRSSCDGDCKAKGNCRSVNSCKAAAHKGHVEYVKQIHVNAGNGPYNNAYCQASISAMVNQLKKQAGGGDLFEFLNGAAQCAYTANNLAGKYPDCIYAHRTPNFSTGQATDADAVNVFHQSCACTTDKLTPPYGSLVHMFSAGNTAGSRMHAMTSTGGCGMISFNSDGIDDMSKLDDGTAQAKGGHSSMKWIATDLACVLKKRIKEKPENLSTLNMARINELAAGQNVYIINGPINGGDVMRRVSLAVWIPDVVYTDETGLLSQTVMDKLLKTIQAITNKASDTMILGDAIMCYATLDKGGAWHVWTWHFTNGIMWIEGAIIWLFSFMFVLAVAYYLLDICFKLGFAAIALPIVVGLWPFKLTSKRLAACVSIILKSAALLVFLAIGVSYGVKMIDVVLEGKDGVQNEARKQDNSRTQNKGGIKELLDRMNPVFSSSTKDIEILTEKEYEDRKKSEKERMMREVGATNDEDLDEKLGENLAYVEARLQLFGINFTLIVFAFLYAFKLVQQTANDIVNKFFSDEAFGDQNPMHHSATAATDLVTKPVRSAAKWAGDVAVNYGSKAAGKTARWAGKTAVGVVAHPIRSATRAVSGAKNVVKNISSRLSK